jgi:hypothetical protein
MKKIKNMEHLKMEKKRILQEQQMLEQKIRQDWQDLKDSVLPGKRASAAGLHASKSKNRIQVEDILKATLAFGASLAIEKLAKAATAALVKRSKKDTDE